jgi:hypothetical protein
LHLTDDGNGTATLMLPRQAPAKRSYQSSHPFLVVRVNGLHQVHITAENGVGAIAKQPDLTVIVGKRELTAHAEGVRMK